MLATPRTGLKSRDCYAQALADCDGGPATQEHYISKSILKLIGPALSIAGTPWAVEPRRVGAGALTSRILCKRHNELLSPLDAEAHRFFEAVDAAGQCEQVGQHVFDGRLIERWGLKVLAGLLASGNALRSDGVSVGDGVERFLCSGVREQFLCYLFGLQPCPSEFGLHVMLAPPGTRAAVLDIIINSVPIGVQEERMVRGITFQMNGLFFTVSFVLLGGDSVWHRPGELRLGQHAVMAFDWDKPSDVMVELGDRRAIPV